MVRKWGRPERGTNQSPVYPIGTDRQDGVQAWLASKGAIIQASLASPVAAALAKFDFFTDIPRAILKP